MKKVINSAGTEEMAANASNMALAMQQQSSISISQESNSNSLTHYATTRFPWKLHQMLVQTELEGHQSIVSWLPNGKAFKVHRKTEFANKILPVYFKTNKYKSFQRNLNLWGFEAVTTGPNKGATFHQCFVRGLPALCRHMVRKTLNSKGDQSTTTLGKFLPPPMEGNGMIQNEQQSSMNSKPLQSPQVENAIMPQKPPEITNQISTQQQNMLSAQLQILSHPALTGINSAILPQANLLAALAALQSGCVAGGNNNNGGKISKLYPSLMEQHQRNNAILEALLRPGLQFGSPV